jgi:branched-chain amino acid transport system ATP-binding protein
MTTETMPAGEGAGSMPTNGAEAMLVVDDVHTYYGQIHALRGIKITVGKGEVVTLIGANGAGKTTTLKTITGLLHARQGSVQFEGEDITQTAAHELVERGIGHAPEGRRIFARLTVLENLQMGAFSRRKANIQPDIDRVYELFPRLQERAGQLGGTLSGGEQQMLAIGRALMAEPRLLLLDEPSLGLAPILVVQVFEKIKQINSQGTTVLLVEQNALQALSIAHRGYVLQTGEVVLSGTAESLRQNETVRKAYLGED